MKSKRKLNTLGLFLIVGVLVATVVFSIYLYFNAKKKKILSNIQNEIAEVNKYYVYGTHFNIECMIDNLESNNIKDIKYELVDISENEKEYNAIYEIHDNKIKVMTSNKINEGIYLEDIESGRYILLLKIKKNTVMLFIVILLHGGLKKKVKF